MAEEYSNLEVVEYSNQVEVEYSSQVVEVCYYSGCSLFVEGVGVYVVAVITIFCQENFLVS